MVVIREIHKKLQSLAQFRGFLNTPWGCSILGPLRGTFGSKVEPLRRTFSSNLDPLRGTLSSNLRPFRRTFNGNLGGAYKIPGAFIGDSGLAVGTFIREVRS